MDDIRRTFNELKRELRDVDDADFVKALEGRLGLDKTKSELQEATETVQNYWEDLNEIFPEPKPDPPGRTRRSSKQGPIELSSTSEKSTDWSDEGEDDGGESQREEGQAQARLVKSKLPTSTGTLSSGSDQDDAFGQEHLDRSEASRRTSKRRESGSTNRPLDPDSSDSQPGSLQLKLAIHQRPQPAARKEERRRPDSSESPPHRPKPKRGRFDTGDAGDSDDHMFDSGAISQGRKKAIVADDESEGFTPQLGGDSPVLGGQQGSDPSPPQQRSDRNVTARRGETSTTEVTTRSRKHHQVDSSSSDNEQHIRRTEIEAKRPRLSVSPDQRKTSARNPHHITNQAESPETTQMLGKPQKPPKSQRLRDFQKPEKPNEDSPVIGGQGGSGSSRLQVASDTVTKFSLPPKPPVPVKPSFLAKSIPVRESLLTLQEKASHDSQTSPHSDNDSPGPSESQQDDAVTEDSADDSDQEDLTATIESYPDDPVSSIPSGDDADQGDRPAGRSHPDNPTFPTPPNDNTDTAPLDPALVDRNVPSRAPSTEPTLYQSIIPMVVWSEGAWKDIELLPEETEQAIRSKAKEIQGTNKKKKDRGRLWIILLGTPKPHCVAQYLFKTKNGEPPTCEACDDCLSKNRLCAVIVVIDGTKKFGVYPVPEKFRGDATEDEQGFWFLPASVPKKDLKKE